MKIIGIDPGLRNMGWGVIAVDGPRLRHLGNGIVHSESGDLGPRLSALYRGLCAVIAEHRPDAAAVEQTFVNKDASGTLKLGQARGIALVMFTLTTVSSGVSARSFSKVSAVLSHTMATRAPWSTNCGRSSWAV